MVMAGGAVARATRQLREKVKLIAASLMQCQADQVEVRDIASVRMAIDRSSVLTLLFDPEHALDDRIVMEQFAF